MSQNAAEERASNAETTAKNYWDEVQAQHFINGVQAQGIEQLEQEISLDRMNQNESVREKNRKHKQALKRLKDERNEHEVRCENMMEQMQDQMNAVQEACMSRINSLEEELLEEKHQKDIIVNELTKMKTVVFKRTADLAIAHKQIEDMRSRLSVGSAHSESPYDNDSDTDEASGNETD